MFDRRHFHTLIGAVRAYLYLTYTILNIEASSCPLFYAFLVGKDARDLSITWHVVASFCAS